MVFRHRIFFVCVWELNPGSYVQGMTEISGDLYLIKRLVAYGYICVCVLPVEYIINSLFGLTVLQFTESS